MRHKAEVDGAVGACLLGYAAEETPGPIDPDTPPIFVPLLELEAMAPGSWYLNVLATYDSFRGRGIGSALLAGGLLAFALSFDEVIVTTFTAGQQTTLPIWMLQELIRPRQRPVTNVVAVVIIALTFIPILAAYWLTRADEQPAGR